MPFIITDPCIETKDTACVDVCPVDCIHPRKDEAEFAQATMLYIHPEECIDCGACVPACPVAAIYESIDATPSHQKDLVAIGLVYFATEHPVIALGITLLLLTLILVFATVLVKFVRRRFVPERAAA